MRSYTQWTAPPPMPVYSLATDWTAPTTPVYSFPANVSNSHLRVLLDSVQHFEEPDAEENV
jgi:hypothetical protein